MSELILDMMPRGAGHVLGQFDLIRRSLGYLADNLPVWSLKFTDGLFAGGTALWGDDDETTLAEQARLARRQAELTRLWAAEVRAEARLAFEEARRARGRSTPAHDQFEEETTRG